MSNELSDRERTIQRRLAGQAVEVICQRLKRSPRWFHKWWRRYTRPTSGASAGLLEGPEGLYDLSHAPRTVIDRIPPELERLIISVRRRLAAHATPDTRYQRIGAPTVLSELRALHLSPLPGLRTTPAPTAEQVRVERVLHRHGLTSPRIRFAEPINPVGYPTPLADDSNRLHQVDIVGPFYLKGRRQRWYVYVCKDVYDGAIYLKLCPSRRMDQVLAFLLDAWHALGVPAQVQFDNAREFVGWGKSARYLTRVIRLCLYLAVTPIFIPQRRPQRNGAVENFNSWFQPLLFQRHFKRPGYLRRELVRLMETANEHHVQPRLGQRTIAQYTCPNRRCGSSRQAAAPAARQTQTRSRSSGHCRRARDLHSISLGPRPDQPVGPNLPDWPAAQVHLRQNRLGYPPPAPDGIRSRQDLQALAVQIEPALTSRICTIPWQWSRPFCARSCGSANHSKPEPRSFGGPHVEM